MTMHRRPIARSRRLSGIGAAIATIGCFLPWWTRGGTIGLPALSGTAFESTGIVVFGAAIATLALLTLPFATDRPVAADRWVSYALITGVAWLGFAYRILELMGQGAFSFAQPTDIVTAIPGLWLVLIGLLAMTRAAYEMLGEPRLR